MGTQVIEIKQDCTDYTALHASHEVVLRVELLAERLAELKPSRSAQVAEIGLGSGDTTKFLASRFDNLICVDIEQQRLDEVARFIAPKSAWMICADAATVEFKQSLDHVFLIGVIEHCPDGEAVLKNIRKQLKPKGRIHILVNNANSLHRHLGVAIGDIDDVLQLSKADIRLGHHRIYSINQLYAECSRAGLYVDYVDHHHIKPLPTSMMDALPIEISRGFLKMARQFPQFAAYTYLEAVAAA